MSYLLCSILCVYQFSLLLFVPIYLPPQLLTDTTTFISTLEVLKYRLYHLAQLKHIIFYTAGIQKQKFSPITRSTFTLQRFLLLQVTNTYQQMTYSHKIFIFSNIFKSYLGNRGLPCKCYSMHKRKYGIFFIACTMLCSKTVIIMQHLYKTASQ